MRRPQEIGRCIFAAIFLVDAVANALIIIFNPGIYRTLADVAIVDFYRDAWMAVVLPNVQLVIGLVVVFELALAVLLILKGAAVRIGLVAAAAFTLMLVPLWWGGAALLILLFAVLLALLAFAEYPRSVAELLRAAGAKGK